MPDPWGFFYVTREEAPQRPIAARTLDWDEIHADEEHVQRNRDVSVQARRCMDCAVPFCHSESTGCPLGNLIPEWNDLVRIGLWDEASERLHATNNFPEFTGRLCPAPCEAACVLSIAEHDSGGAVTIKRIEQTIADTAWERGTVTAQKPTRRTGHTVAVVGSGPAGLAAAQQLTRAGHAVTVFERDDRLGGLLRYGIPAFKMDKSAIDRRVRQMQCEGTCFVTACEVGVDLSVDRLRSDFDAVVLAIGALCARDDASIEGRGLDGVHLAMDYLVAANRECEGDGPTPITARDKHVVVIGGGDTGADCLGTAHRHRAASVTQLDYHPEPPPTRDTVRTPWPVWPSVLRTSPAHAEGGMRRFQVAVRRFQGDERGRVRAVTLAKVRVCCRDADGQRGVVPIGEELSIRCDLALLAIGFAGIERMRLLADYGLELNRFGALDCGPDWQTAASGVFVCGDAHRGAALVVWAIAEGRSAARAVDAFLMGRSNLPDPVHPAARPLGAQAVEFGPGPVR